MNASSLRIFFFFFFGKSHEQEDQPNQKKGSKIKASVLDTLAETFVRTRSDVATLRLRNAEGTCDKNKSMAARRDEVGNEVDPHARRHRRRSNPERNSPEVLGVCS